MARACTPLYPSVGFSHSQLLYFVRVAEAGQISSAARALYVAQPALSQSIARLERQLGLELLERHPRGVTLTPAGEIFLVKAKAVVQASAEAAVAAQAMARCRRRSLQIGFLSVPPALAAPRVMDAFSSAYPEVDVSFHELPYPTAPLADWMFDVDLAICHSPVAHEGVEVEPLWREPCVVLMNTSHELAEQRELRVSEVLDQRFCGFHSDVDRAWATQWTLDEARGGAPELLTRDTPANALELVAAIASGEGIGVVPSNVARTVAGVLPQLAARPLVDAAPAVCAMVRRPSKENSLSTTFLQTARASLRAPAA